MSRKWDPILLCLRGNAEIGRPRHGGIDLHEVHSGRFERIDRLRCFVSGRYPNRTRPDRMGTIDKGTWYHEAWPKHHAGGDLISPAHLIDRGHRATHLAHARHSVCEKQGEEYSGPLEVP